MYFPLPPPPSPLHLYCNRVLEIATLVGICCPLAYIPMTEVYVSYATQTSFCNAWPLPEYLLVKNQVTVKVLKSNTPCGENSIMGCGLVLIGETYVVFSSLFFTSWNKQYLKEFLISPTIWLLTNFQGFLYTQRGDPFQCRIPTKRLKSTTSGVIPSRGIAIAEGQS